MGVNRLSVQTVKNRRGEIIKRNIRQECHSRLWKVIKIGLDELTKKKNDASIT